ncbi:hypothetical protein Hte_002093 [Hypoxylon texense]
MEPFSIATGVVQLISFADGLIKRLAHFIGTVKSIPEYIRDVRDEITTLTDILREVKRTLDRRARQLPFELNHHAKTYKIVHSCHKSLEALDEELPPFKDGSGIMKRVWRSIEHSFNEERIRQITNRIGTYRSILNISLTTLLLPALSETATSQQEIQIELRKLTNLIESSSLFSRHTDHEDLVAVQTHCATSKGSGVENSILEKEVRDWRQTVDDVATGVVTMSYEGSCDASSVAPGSSTSVDTLTLCDDKFDPEPDLTDEQDSDILKSQLDANQVLVRKFMEGGMFPNASIYQRKGISLLKQLSDSQGTAISEDASYRQLADMEEELADILLGCQRDKYKQEAMEMLKRLLKGEVNRGDRTDKVRRTRLYHKLGELYYKRGSIGQASSFLNRALKGRRQLEPMPRELVEESAGLLVKVLQQAQAFGEANGLREWIYQQFHQDTSVPPSSTSTHTVQEIIDPTRAYRWCEEHGIDTESESFRFGDCDPVSETTPMHRAIQAEDIDVLRNMLWQEGGVERRDMSGSALLHAAAATRNHNICEILLEEYFANPLVLDQSGMTPLHRCQSGSGGVKVAKLLFETCRDLIDRADCFGKTALYLACEKGNAKMVKFLLEEAKADPNLQGPGQRTPLITTIDDVTRSFRKIDIVRLLIQSHADPWIKDVDGRTAFTAASNIGLASGEIKRMLSEVPRRASSATVKTISLSSDGRSSNQSGRTV